MKIENKIKQNLSGQAPLRSLSFGGQAYIETIFITPVFVIFLIIMTFFAKVYITKIILEQAARHGVFLIINSKYDESQVKGEIVDYLTVERHLLKDFKEENIEVEVTHGFSPSTVTIRYELPVPALLSKLRGNNNPFSIAGHSECINDTWAGEDFFKLVKNVFKGA